MENIEAGAEVCLTEKTLNMQHAGTNQIKIRTTLFFIRHVLLDSTKNPLLPPYFKKHQNGTI